MGKSTYAMGGRSKRTCAYDGGGWLNFCYFGAYVLIEYPKAPMHKCS